MIVESSPTRPKHTANIQKDVSAMSIGPPAGPYDRNPPTVPSPRLSSAHLVLDSDVGRCLDTSA